MRKIVDAANAAAGIFIGLYFVAITLIGTQSVRRAPELILSHWGTWGWLAILVIGGLLVYGNILVLVREWKTGGLRRNLKIMTEHGSSELSVSALEALVLRHLESVPGVVDPVVVLIPCGVGKPMRCEIEMKLREQKDIVGYIDSIKADLLEEFDKLHPGRLTVDIHVQVRDFVGSSPRTAQAAPMETPVANGFNYSAFENHDAGDRDPDEADAADEDNDRA